MALDLVGNAAARIGINQTDLICLYLLTRRGPMSPSQIASSLGPDYGRDQCHGRAA